MTISFIEILDRAHEGTYCSSKEWDLKIIPKVVKQKLDEHGLTGTFSKDNPVPYDDSLADDFFKAGFEIAVETGMFCMDTERIIKFDERELRTIINEMVPEMIIGKGHESHLLRYRSARALTEYQKAKAPL